MSRGWEGIQRQIDLGVEKSQDKCLSILEVRRAGLGAPSRWPEPRSRRAGSFPCTHPLTPPLGLDSPSAASQTMDSLISDLDPLKDWKVLRQACFLSLPSLFSSWPSSSPPPPQLMNAGCEVHWLWWLSVTTSSAQRNTPLRQGNNSNTCANRGVRSLVSLQETNAVHFNESVHSFTEMIPYTSSLTGPRSHLYYCISWARKR